MLKIIKFLYRLYLRKRFKMTPEGSAFLRKIFLDDYKKYKFFKCLYIHTKGYTVEDWDILNINKNNYSDYMSTAEYLALHPINGHYSRWIDDKLTLKLLFNGTELSKYMPEYYYHIDENGQILCLPDCKEKKDNAAVQDIIDLLEEKNALAFKLLSGSIGEGFYKAEFREGKYYLNNKKYNKEEFSKEILKLKNYLITEFLYPNSIFAEFCDKTLNPIRFLAGKLPGEALKFLKGFVRFGTSKTGFVENYNRGGILCYIDENGWFESGEILERERERVYNRSIRVHPDTQKFLKGRVPMFEEIKICVDLIGKIFPELKYIGIDFVVTNKNEIKILEINSLPSLDALQLKGPWHEVKKIVKN